MKKDKNIPKGDTDKQKNQTQTNDVEKQDKSETNDQKTSKTKKILHKIVKEDSAFSIIKVIATMLTAVTIAFLSSKLTGYVGTLVLVALLSIGTAILTEIYRIIISITTIGAKTVVKPILRINPDGTTTEIPIVKKIEPESKTIIDPDDESETQRSHGTNKQKHNKIIKYFQRNPIMRFMLLFMLTSVVTIGATYYMTEKNQHIITEHNTTINKTETKELTQKEKDELMNSFLSKVPNNTVIITPPIDENENTDTTTQETNPTTITEHPTSTTTNDNPQPTKETNPTNTATVTETENTQTIQTLQKQIQDLQTQNTKLQEQLKTLQQNSAINKTLQDQINAMRKTITTLEEQIKTLQDNNNNSTLQRNNSTQGD